MTFKNLPTDKKEEEIATSQELLPITETNSNMLKTVISWGVKGFVVIVVVVFLGWKAFDGIKSVVQVKDELIFAYQHPQLVKPMRELYTLSHQKADEDLKQILNGGKE